MFVFFYLKKPFLFIIFARDSLNNSKMSTPAMQTHPMCTEMSKIGQSYENRI